MADTHAHDHHEGHHIIPFKVLTSVFGALIFLTVLTVLTAKYVDLGPLNVPLAIAIASTKAALVVTIFMALKYDKSVNTMVFSIGTVFVVVFLAFTLLDTTFRGDLGNVNPVSISEQERINEDLRMRDPAFNAGAAAASDTTSADTTSADTTSADTTSAEAQ